MVGLFGVCFFLIGYVHGSSIMYMIAFSCFGVLVIGLGFAWLSLRDLRCERSATGTTVFSGDPLEGKVRLHERFGRWRLLEVYDQHVNLVSGNVTRRRMTLLTEGARRTTAVVAGARQTLRLEGQHGRVLEVRDVMRFARRGHYRLGPLLVQGHDPLGLCSITRLVPAELDVIVYPRPLPIPELVLGGGLGRQSNEVRPIGYAGETAEFHGIRPYVQGDDLRHVHWKATAHTNKLAIKEFEYRISGAVQVVLDLQHGVHVGQRDFSTLETSVTLAASILNHVLATGNQAGLLATGGKLISLPSESGQRQMHRALEALALAKDDGAVSIAQAIAGCSDACSRRCTTIVITPTADTGIIGPLLTLRGRSAQVLLVLLDRTSYLEAEQEQQRKPLNLISIATTPLDLKGLRNLVGPKSTEAHEEHHTLLRAAAAAGIDVYPISPNIPLHQALQGIRMRI
jgi:uncharacterized protein (DUF58 family)